MDKRVATALRYDSSLPAPFVVARGRGELARCLIHLAHQAGVPIESDRELAERLIWLRPGDVIPEALYRPIAEILSFIMELEQRQVKQSDETDPS